MFLHLFRDIKWLLRNKFIIGHHLLSAQNFCNSVFVENTFFLNATVFFTFIRQGLFLVNFRNFPWQFLEIFRNILCTWTKVRSFTELELGAVLFCHPQHASHTDTPAYPEEDFTLGPLILSWVGFVKPSPNPTWRIWIHCSAKLLTCPSWAFSSSPEKKRPKRPGQQQQQQLSQDQSCRRPASQPSQRRRSDSNKTQTSFLCGPLARRIFV